MVIVHDDVPALDPKSLATYIAILDDSVADWKPNDNHELLVVFPTNARGDLVAQLRSGEQF